jgi:hypothetical protein
MCLEKSDKARIHNDEVFVKCSCRSDSRENKYSRLETHEPAMEKIINILSIGIHMSIVDKTKVHFFLRWR